MKNDGGASFSLQRRLQPAEAWRILACSSTERYSTADIIDSIDVKGTF
jgi:hypothetical protein